MELWGSYALRAYKNNVGTMYHLLFFFPLEQGTSYGRGRRRNFKRGSFDWKLRVVVPFLIVESDWSANSPLPTPTISPNTSNQNFDIPVLFSVVDFQVENIFLRRIPPPTTLRARGLSYALGAYKVFIEGVVVETSKQAHSIGN